MSLIQYNMIKNGLISGRGYLIIPQIIPGLPCLCIKLDRVGAKLVQQAVMLWWISVLTVSCL